MRRALVAAVLLLLGVATPATASTDYTFTVQDESGGALPVAQAVAGWDKARGVTVRLGTCDGPDCIHVRLVTDYSQCSGFSCPDGRAYALSDQTCVAQVQTFASVPLFAVGHELGHCMGLPHIDEKGSIMQTGLTVREEQAIDGPSSRDLRRLARLYA